MRYLLMILSVSTLLFGNQVEEEFLTKLSCENCHHGTEWLFEAGKGFDHTTTAFELQGTHLDITCIQCHKGTTPKEKHDFASISSECSSCHTDVHQDQWGQDCQHCHNPSSWTLATEFQNHNLTRFPLIGPHTNVNCEACHIGNTNGSDNLSTDCLDCHLANYTSSANPNHQLLDLNTDCESCHASTSKQWAPSLFSHNNTGFFLLGMHGEVDCAACHTGPATATESSCESCHMKDYNESVNPPHIADGYPTDCASCHDKFTWNSWFNHEQTGYSLRDAHTEIVCADCHIDGDFNDTPENCAGCHLDNWEATVLPSHQDAEFDDNCSDCHNEVAWQPSPWDHDTQTTFIMTGSHIDLTCDLCHTSAPYSSQGTACVDCHIDNYNATTEPSHTLTGLPTSCEVCHATDFWNSQHIDHVLTGFPLLGAHTNATCEACHVNGYDLPLTCDGCHEENFNNTTTPNHIESGFPITICETCHSEDAWSPSIFLHANTILECSSCHMPEYNGTTEPPHVTMQISLNCAECHVTESWTPSSFVHDVPTTGFLVDGSHLVTNCTQCHTTWQIEPTPRTCADASCHLTNYNETTNPPHFDFSFPTTCAECHNTTAWQPGLFVHDIETTGFQLDGSHTTTTCTSCHDNWIPPSEVRTCYDASCHLTNYTETINPPHVDYNMPTICSDCHTTTVWTPSTFSHDVPSTGFLVDGAHETTGCIGCHSNWEPSTGIRTCSDASCHITNYNETTNPPHLSSAFPTTCNECHSTSVWQPSSFVHDVVTTGFLIDGAHETATCNSCHETWDSPDVPRTCADASCHNTTYNETINPPHLAFGFPTTCETCHTTTVWQPSSFVHAVVTTGFLIDGAHETATCNSCHEIWDSPDVPRSCADATCHLTTYNETANPPHVASNLSTTCETCHTTSVWQPSSFIHDVATTGFLIDGAHVEITSCNSCHETWDSPDVPRSCSDATCHITTYNETTNPPHVASNLPTTCETCHTTSVWQPSSFIHDVVTTGFLIDGAHVEITSCNSCHETWDSPDVPRSCSDATCHISNYNETTNPPHLASSFPTTCASCHTTTVWTPSSFVHDVATTGFLLQGAHTSVSCSECHSSWPINPPIRTCGSATCHLDDYNSTTDPNHSSSSFPLDCSSCHSNTAWTPVTFNHDSQYFPIYSGKHRNEWNSCSQCHSNSSNYADFTCFGSGCHSISEMNSEHWDDGQWESCNGITYPGSSVTPADCYFCHPSGDEDDCDGDLLNDYRKRTRPLPIGIKDYETR